ncbi:MAG: hypothetical protein IH986_01795 [Planctomycetes bacterium]|nr:hypothetical protein [Planctomycetota bacterium]
MARARTVSVALILLLLAGCNGNGGGGGSKPKSVLMYEPDWDFANHQRIVVLPAQAGDPQALEAAEQLTDWLADLLERSGRFTVVGYSMIEESLGADQVARLADGASSTGFPLLVGKTEALVVCKITDYEIGTDEKPMIERRHAIDKKGRASRDASGEKIVVGEDEYTLHTHRGGVGGTLRVLDVVSGGELLTHSTPTIVYERTQKNSPPRATPEELAIDASRELAADFFKRVSPYSLDYKYRSNMLRIAVDFYRGEYEEQRKIPLYAEKVILIVRDLPHQCERGKFTLTLTPKDGGARLIEHTFIWSPAVGKRGETAEIAIGDLKATGQTKFTAALYAGTDTGAKHLIDHDFKLEQPDEGN